MLFNLCLQVFQRLAPPLAVNPIAGANSSNINNNINISNNSNIHGNDRDKSKDTDNAGNNQAKRRHSVTSDIESEGSPIKKRKSRDTRATTSAAATVPAGAIRTLEAPVLFSWEDVLNCVKRPLTLSPRPTPTATATSAHATPQLASATGSAASASASSAAPTSAVAPTETAAQDGEEKTDEPKRRPANIVVRT